MAEVVKFEPRKTDSFALAANILLKGQLDFIEAVWGIKPKLPEATIIPFPGKRKMPAP